MKVGILQVGQVAPEVLVGIREGLLKAFPDTAAAIIQEVLPVPQSAFDKKRNQYSSALILNEIRVYAAKREDFHCVLGVVEVDIFASGLNYVFGEAYTPGGAALISLWRLKTEFYKDKPNMALYVLRAQKEAVHELGHTLGVRHCPRSLCVMHFSNSIFDTDKKQSLLCDECYLQAAITISNLG
ncbi:MAG: archaemetzincin family Zn-dependent metalloprotease [Candidatus Bathyarchaeota archaeon]|nr:archaemetzincin family Zn-dependent metalloprotease [Candidatus Bathyarchaeota archaeon]